MSRLSRLVLSLFPLGFFLVVWPMNAQCVSCGPGGECFEASPGFSANCECKIRVFHGAVVCTPSGICDPSDSTTCGNTPPQNLTAGGEISTKFINRLAEKNPLLAGAVWGAITEQDSASKEILHSYLVAGEYTGTMGKDGKSYTFKTRGQPLAGGVFSLAVHVEEDGTGRAEDFEGTVLERGRSGSMERTGREGRVSVFSWNAREPEKK